MPAWFEQVPALHVSAPLQNSTEGVSVQLAPLLPAGCWQVALEPLHWSSVHGFASLVHPVGLGMNWQVTGLQHSPNGASHCSPASSAPPLPQFVPAVDTTVLMLDILFAVSKANTAA